MLRMQALAVIGENLDYPAMRNFLARALDYHPLQFDPKRFEAGDPALDLGKPRTRDGIRRGAGLGRLVLQRQQGANGVNLEPKLAGVPDEGEPLQVTDIVPVSKDIASILRLAAALDAGSSHPLAKAILAKAAAAGIDAKPATDAAAICGKGVTGIVDGVTLFLFSA